MSSRLIPSVDIDDTDIKKVEEFKQIIPRSYNDLSPRRIARLLVYLLGTAIVAWHLYYAEESPIALLQHSNIHLGLLIAVFYLTTLKFNPDDWRDHFDNVVSMLFLVATVLGTTYVHLNYHRWLNEGRMLLYNQVDILVGIFIIAVAIHATWRAYGRVLALIIFGSFLFGYFGPQFPTNFANGIFYHSGLSLERMIVINSVALNGLYGSILQVSATWVVIFILFAGIIEAYGGIDYIITAGKKARMIISSGVMQTAVISSMIMGSISGAAAANVATTGSFTIPLMKSEGVKSRYAASIESIASTGGQILPPVMGSASFLMADILAISYTKVIFGALLPALMFYVTVALVVHLTSIKHGWTHEYQAGELETDERSIFDHLLEAGPYIAAIVTLIYTLTVLRYDPLTAGMYTIIITMATALMRDFVIQGPTPSTIYKWGRRTIEGARIGAVNMAPLTAVLASLGIVIQILTSTGFTQRFTLSILAIAGGVFILVLILTMAASLIFGMGMPTPAAYLVVAILTAPALTKLGIAPLNAHMFVFYFALLSTITPPVALACAVGANVADCDFMAVCKETVRLGLFAFITPFVFVMNPSLIMWTTPTETGLTFLLSVIGFAALAIAIVGYDLREHLSLWQRGIYFSVGIALFFLPQMLIQVALATILVGWLTYIVVNTDPAITEVSTQSK